MISAWWLLLIAPVALAALLGWAVAWAVTQELDERKDAATGWESVYGEAADARDEARERLSELSVLLIRERQEHGKTRDELATVRGEKCKLGDELEGANEVNTGLVEDLKRVTAERDSAWRRIDGAKAELSPPCGVPVTEIVLEAK